LCSLAAGQAEVGPSVIGAAPRAVQCDGTKLLPLRANLGGGGGVDNRLADGGGEGVANGTTTTVLADDADADGGSGTAAGETLPTPVYAALPGQ